MKIPSPLDFDAGIVYAAFNQHQQLHKIGLTRRSAERRVFQLNTAGVIGKWILLAQINVVHVAKIEKFLHRKYEKYHIQGELFKINHEWILNDFKDIQQEQLKTFQSFLSIESFQQGGLLEVTDYEFACEYLLNFL